MAEVTCECFDCKKQLRIDLVSANFQIAIYGACICSSCKMKHWLDAIEAEKYKMEHSGVLRRVTA